MLAALPAGFGCALPVILEIAAARRAALARDLALLAVPHSCESTSFGHFTLLFRTTGSGPTDAHRTDPRAHKTISANVGWSTEPPKTTARRFDRSTSYCSLVAVISAP